MSLVKPRLTGLYTRGEGNKVVYLRTDVILWLAWGFCTSALCLSHTHKYTVWSQADIAADLKQGPYELNFLPQTAKTTKNNNQKCMLTYADRKEINKKQTRRLSGEMKGGLEGRRLEFSTSVTLAGLSIMCDVVEAKRRSESGRVGCLQARSHVFHPWTQDRIGFFYISVLF